MASDRLLRHRISDLKKLEEKCFASRKRFEFYCYLAAVYQLYIDLRRDNATQHLARRIAKLFNVATHRDIHLIRLIIDASSQSDARNKSRWTRALRFAWVERRRWSDLETFLQRNGGPAGCAGQFAALHPRAPGGCMRVGGENRVPRIPLYVSDVMPKVSLHGKAVNPIGKAFAASSSISELSQRGDESR